MTDDTRFLIDVTTSALPEYIGRQPVGIVRVEREIAKRYYDHEPRSVFIRFDHVARCFRLLSRRFAGLVIGKDRGDGLGPVESEADYNLDPAFFGDQLSYGSRVEFRKNDMVISAGLAWDTDMLGYVFALKKAFGFRVAQVIYDIVPIIMPEYCVPGMELRFPKFLLDVANTADLIFCISDRTQADLARYFADFGIAAPAMERIHLGNTLADVAVPTPPRTEVGAGPLVRGNFIVYVSTLEPRKNHHMLFDLWRELRQEFKEQLPALVFVGRVGWNMNNLLSYIWSCSDLFPTHLHLLHGVSDSELLWLYENARFTVYPSLYEGWGLPVVEALSKGKVCVASNRSSIPEAAAGYAELLDPFDHVGWRKKIAELLRDESAVRAREQEIRKGFRPLDWATGMQGFQDRVASFMSRQMERVHG